MVVLVAGAVEGEDEELAHEELVLEAPRVGDCTRVLPCKSKYHNVVPFPQL